MGSILTWLFESGLTMPMNKEEEHRYAEAGEDVLVVREAVRSRMPAELREYFQTYLDKQEAHHEWERKVEFERGFYLAVRLFQELKHGGVEL